MHTLTDHIGRSFKVLRVSLLDKCNFACTYCVCEDGGTTTTQRSSVLSSDELIDLIGRLHDLLDLQTVRLTGGEPLLYPDLTKLVMGIRQLGIHDIKMTTNGCLLAKKPRARKIAVQRK